MKLALAGIAAGLVLAAGAALAQAPSAQPAAPKAEVVKTVGDWQVRCFGVQNTNPCDMFWQHERSAARASAWLRFRSPMRPAPTVIYRGPDRAAGGFHSQGRDDPDRQLHLAGDALSHVLA